MKTVLNNLITEYKALVETNKKLKAQILDEIEKNRLRSVQVSVHEAHIKEFEEAIKLLKDNG